ncbi:unnamed protein product [Alternaria alternata]
MPELLSSAHANCVSAFESLIRTLDPKNRGIHDQTMPADIKRADIKRADIKEEFDRYKIWAGSVGATQLGKHDETLLEYRLREASFLKDQTLKLLSTLRDRIDTTDKICSKPGSYEEREEESDSEESTSSNCGVNCEEKENEFEDSPWEISSDSSDDDGSLSKHQLIRDKPQTSSEDSTKAITTSGPSVRYIPMSVSRLVESIRFTVTSLYRLPISDPAPLDRVGYKTSIESDVCQHSDIKYVKSKFPHIEPRVATRLGKMITRRRQTLAYREAHKSSLVSNTMRAQAAPFSEDSRASSTEARSNQATLVSPEPGRSLVAPSTVSSASTVEELHATTDLRVETFSRPNNDDGQKLEQFECPYCFLTINMSNDQQYQKHILEDLQPYVCTYGDCDLYDHFFDSEDAWFNHEVHHHRALWFCNTDGHELFDLEGDFLSHMEEIHNHKFKGMRFNLVKNMFRHPTKSLKGTCNLCRHESEDLKSHLSEHLQRMALFALSRVDETVRKGEVGVYADSPTHKKYNLKDDESSRSSRPRSSISFDRSSTATSFRPSSTATSFQRSSTPTSSSRPRDTTQQQYLSRQISASIESTVVGVPHSEAQIRRFLPKGDLTTILSEQALRNYLKELFGESTDEIVENALHRIVGDPERNEPPRRALLALFLYHQRSGLLHYFRDWLLSRQNDSPSDKWLPFDQNRLTNTIPARYHEYIKDYQYIFIPSTIREDMHQLLQSKERLPFIGAPLAVTDGSSGTVFTREVAPGHWEKKFKNGRHVPADTTKPTVLAFKVFSGGHTGQEAEMNFQIERSILEELRSSNYIHKMILLDSGSFVIQDKIRIIQHCLIFERATCTLEDFLTDEKEALKPWTGSLLLTNLVDLVQALACLHDSFDILHLDIKPENILVFARPPSQSKDGTLEEAKFEWKISDFGLARKRHAKERTGPLYDRNRSASQPVSLPATRPAGRFQAPEVQQRSSSKAGRSSDVWSIGCVILMVLGFIVDGPSRVSELLWRKVTLWVDYHYEYLDNYKPVIGDVPGVLHMQAAVHPGVVEWSNELFYYCTYRPEQPALKEALGIVFKRVLLIEKNGRIGASSLSKCLADVRDRWKEIEASPLRGSDDQDGTLVAPLIPVESLPVASDHSKLCSAITQISAASPGEQPRLWEDFRDELRRDPSQVRRPCPSPKCCRHPIHVAIRNKSYGALEDLLFIADSDDLNIRCSGCGDRTALEEACEEPGDEKALKCFKPHKSKLEVTKSFYDDHKHKMTKSAKEALKGLLQDSGQQRRDGNLLQRMLTGRFKDSQG